MKPLPKDWLDALPCLSIPQASHVLSMHPDTVHRKIRDQVIPTCPKNLTGGHVRIPISYFQELAGRNNAAA